MKETSRRLTATAPHVLAIKYAILGLEINRKDRVSGLPHKSNESNARLKPFFRLRWRFSDTDLREAAQKQAAYLKAQKVTKTVTIDNFVQKKISQSWLILTSTGAPGVTRTPGTGIRNPLLYPPELRGQALVNLPYLGGSFP